MVRFEITSHSTKPNIQIIEVWQGNDFIASIYPTEDGIKLISKFIINPVEEVIEIDREPPIAISIHIKQPY